MKKLLLISLAVLMAVLTACESRSVSNGRIAYENYFKQHLKDPASFTVYSETYQEDGKFNVKWTLDYGAKNSFGGMVRKTVKFTTTDRENIFFENGWEPE